MQSANRGTKLLPLLQRMKERGKNGKKREEKGKKGKKWEENGGFLEKKREKKGKNGKVVFEGCEDFFAYRFGYMKTFL